MLRIALLASAIVGITLATGCKSVEGSNKGEKQANVREVRDTALADLYKQKPAAKGEVEGAAGYAVFTNIGINLFVVASGNGYGCVTNNKTNHVTYMKMREVGVGIGLGAKDFRAVIIFTDAAVMKKFVDSGWEFGGEADAAAKSGDSGDAAAGAASVGGMIIYQLTDAGLALQATVSGTKYWKDDELN